MYIWDCGSKKGPSVYYKKISGRTFKVDACHCNVCIITNLGHCNSMMDRLISSAYERSCRGPWCLVENKII